MKSGWDCSEEQSRCRLLKMPEALLCAGVGFLNADGVAGND